MKANYKWIANFIDENGDAINVDIFTDAELKLMLRVFKTYLTEEEIHTDDYSYVGPQYTINIFNGKIVINEMAK